MNVGNYSKFIASLGGLFVVYVQQYGLTWQTVPAATGIAAAFAVFGVSNTGAAGQPSTLVADITAAMDELLSRRLVRIPKPATAPATPPTAGQQVVGTGVLPSFAAPPAAPDPALAAVAPQPEPIPGSQP